MCRPGRASWKRRSPVYWGLVGQVAKGVLVEQGLGGTKAARKTCATSILFFFFLGLDSTSWRAATTRCFWPRGTSPPKAIPSSLTSCWILSGMWGPGPQTSCPCPLDATLPASYELTPWCFLWCIFFPLLYGLNQNLVQKLSECSTAELPSRPQLPLGDSERLPCIQGWP